MARRGQQLAHSGGRNSKLNAYSLKKVINRRILHPHRRHLLITPHYSFSETRRQSSISTSTPPPPLYYPMKQALPMMLVVLTLKYQSKAETIFQENAVALGCLIASTFAYWLIMGKIKENTSCTTLWWGALASALLSVISSVCILLPYPSLSSVVLLSLVMSSSVSMALLMLILYPFGLLIEWGVKKMHDLFVWARGPPSCTVEQV